MYWRNYNASQSYSFNFLCIQCFYICLYCKRISYGVLPPLHHYILLFTFFSTLVCKVNHLKVSLCQWYFYLAFYCLNSIFFLSNIFLTQKISHKHFSRESGHSSIGKNLLIATVTFPSPGIFRWRLDALANSMLWPNISSGLNTRIPRAYNIRKIRFVIPLEPSSPSCAFGLEAQKSKKIHNRASYN